MASWATIGYQIGVRSIEAAYETSRKTFEKEEEALEAEWDRHIAEKTDDGDENLTRIYEDHLGDLHDDADRGLRLIIESFVLALYHYWEQETCMLLGLKKADHKEICKKASHQRGLSLDEPGLERLRLIAITIKHNNGRSLYEKEPNLFGPELKSFEGEDHSGWHYYLRLTDEDFKKAVATVKASGPNQHWPGGSEIIDDDGIEEI